MFGIYEVNLHIFILAQNQANIFWYLLGDRLNIGSIATLFNTQMPQSLFELVWIKEAINYQYCKMETKDAVPSFKE